MKKRILWQRNLLSMAYILVTNFTLFYNLFLLMIRTQVSATRLMILTVRILLQKLGLCSYIDFIPSYGDFTTGYLKMEDGSEIGALDQGMRLGRALWITLLHFIVPADQKLCESVSHCISWLDCPLWRERPGDSGEGRRSSQGHVGLVCQIPSCDSHRNNHHLLVCNNHHTQNHQGAAASQAHRIEVENRRFLTVLTSIW